MKKKRNHPNAPPRVAALRRLLANSKDREALALLIGPGIDAPWLADQAGCESEWTNTRFQRAPIGMPLPPEVLAFI